MTEEFDDMIPVELPDVQLLTEEELRIKADTIIVEAGTNSIARSKAITEVCELLIGLNDDLAANDYIKQLSKAHKFSVKDFRDKYIFLKKEKEGSVSDEPAIVAIPKDADTDEDTARKLGFYKWKNCSFFITKDGAFKGTNFSIKPLFHIYSKQDNKRLIEINNEFNFKKIVDIASRNFVSVDMFQQRVIEEGNFIIFGTKSHFLKVLSSISNDFPVCNELRTLGWQREGFYAFANGIFNGKYTQVDNYGIVGHEEEKYFLPAFSCVYSGVREDDDEYENDRFFVYKESPIKFNDWAKLMLKVYGVKARIAIAYAITAIFRDAIYEKYKIFPHLFLFGEKQSGKSQMGWSLSNLFMDNLPPFNLNSGTQVGFFRRLARVKNGLAWFDEYTNDVDEKRFQSLKAAYDGVGHEKGKMSKDSRTEITKVNSACVISGQYLPTRDDNALFTRSIVLNFEKKTYNEEDILNYDSLKKCEEQGISSIICEILKYRTDIDKKFGMAFSEIFDSIKTDMINSNQQFEERLLRNFCTVLAPVKILQQCASDIDFGFTFEELYNQSREMVSELSAQISSSEALATFWNLMEFMLDSNMIQNGVDFQIKTKYEVNTKDANQHIKVDFRDANGNKFPEKIIYIRFSKIHPLYLEAHRKQHGVNGIDLVSLMHYVKHHKAYIGYVDSERFSSTIVKHEDQLTSGNSFVSSAFAFRYNFLNMNLERYVQQAQTDDEPF
jgi:hypothetical protein